MRHRMIDPDDERLVQDLTGAVLDSTERAEILDAQGKILDDAEEPSANDVIREWMLSAE